MKHAALMVLLLATPLLSAIPTIRAEDELVCVLDICVVTTDNGPLSDTCQSRHYNSAGAWSFQVGSLRDPPLPGTHYLATWSFSWFYERISDRCQETAYSCNVHISDGSNFQYLRVGSASSANGDYKGIPSTGGTLACSTTNVTLLTYAGLILTVNGAGNRVI